MSLTFATPRRPRWRRWRTLLIVVVVVAVGAGAYLFFSRRDSSPSLPAGTADAFLAAWQRGDARAMAATIDTPPADLPTMANALVQSAPGSTATYRRTTLVRTKPGATATYHAQVDLAGFGHIAWDGTLTFVRAKVGKATEWRVHWMPAVLYPGLAAGQHVTMTHTWPARASILAADGTLLAGNQAIITIGLEPDRVTQSLPQIKQLLGRLVGTDPATVDAALHAPGVRPNYFVPVAVVPDDAHFHDVLDPQLRPVPGVFFHRSKGIVAGGGTVGSLDEQIVGHVGDITADGLKQLGPPYRAGDQVGLSGLQATYEKRLAGKPSADVVVVAGTRRVRTLEHFRGAAPQAVRVTIDLHTQQAAERALAAVTKPAALVAIDATTGQIRAVVSKPGGGFDRALEGTYPPGSTFKVVTSAALLANGSTGATPAPCPATLTVDGHVFHNFEGEAPGSLNLAPRSRSPATTRSSGWPTNFPPARSRAATSFGFNAHWTLPINATGGSYPTPSDRVELAASAIGQGRVIASPAQMASVAATVAAGRWHAPVLTTEPAPKPPVVAPLSARVAAELQSFMAGPLQPGGTAAGAGLPAGTSGKTGTAEFGNDNPPRTHAWFIGYRNGLAFAVVVEGGGVGGSVAAPLAAEFLTALGS